MTKSLCFHYLFLFLCKCAQTFFSKKLFLFFFSVCYLQRTLDKSLKQKIQQQKLYLKIHYNEKMAFYYSKLLEAKVFKNSCCSVIDKCHERIVKVNITVRDQQMLSYIRKSFIPDEFAHDPKQILRAMEN